MKRLLVLTALIVAAVLLPASVASALDGGEFSGIGPARLGPFDPSVGVNILEWDREQSVTFRYESDRGSLTWSAGGETGSDVINVPGKMAHYINVVGPGRWWLRVTNPMPTTAPLGAWESGTAGTSVSDPFYLPTGTIPFLWDDHPNGTKARVYPLVWPSGIKSVDINSFIVSPGTIYVLQVTAPADWAVYMDTPDSAVVSIYRFYDNQNGSHFYTSSEAERDLIMERWTTEYTYEGLAYTINGMNSLNNWPLMRFRNCSNGAHFWTTSFEERRIVPIRFPAWWYEGPTFAVSMSSGSPVYRFYNRKAGTHFYTASAEEWTMVQQRWPDVFIYEGVGYYVAP